MPTFSVESPSRPLFPWTIESGFGVILGKLQGRNARSKPMVMSFPEGVVVRGPEKRVLRTPMHWTIMRDTLVEADELEIFSGALVHVDVQRKLGIWTSDPQANQIAGLFYNAHPRVILRPNTAGDGFMMNSQWREQPITIPFSDGQEVVFDLLDRAFRRITRTSSRSISAR